MGLRDVGIGIGVILRFRLHGDAGRCGLTAKVGLMESEPSLEQRFAQVIIQ